MVTNLRATRFIITRFDENHRYSDILTVGGSVLDTSTGAIWKVGRPLPTDGTYTYERLTESTARIVKTASDGAVETATLQFADDASGTLEVTWAGSHVSLNNPDFRLIDASGYRQLPLLNASLRGHVGAGSTLIAGFVIPGSAPQIVLVRALGPGLVPFGVTNVWSDPTFRVYRGADPIETISRQQVSRHYDDWSSEPAFVPPAPQDGALATGFNRLFAYLGASPLTVGSKDAAQVLLLDPGAYTVVCTAQEGNPGGETLIEVYLLP